MHQIIMGEPPDDMIIDHININKVDHRICNLRFATRSQNSQNKPKINGTTSKYIGVSWAKNNSKWRAQVNLDKILYNLGYYHDETDAGKIYDTVILLYYGKDSQTNNLVNFDYIKDLDINTFFVENKKKEKEKKQKENNIEILPKYIRKKNDKYEVRIAYNNINYCKTLSSLQLAEEQLAKFLEIIDNLKLAELAEHNATQIIRNDKNIAIVPVKDKNNTIVDYFTVSDDMWHKVTLYSWNKYDKYFKAYIEGEKKSIHRFIMNVTDKKTSVKHIDGNPKNNITENLKIQKND
jgi:hypothetical protein